MGKTLKVTGIGLAICAVGYFLYKEWRKSWKKIEKEEKERKQEYDNLGIEPEKMEEESVSGDGTFSNLLFTATTLGNFNECVDEEDVTFTNMMGEDEVILPTDSNKIIDWDLRNVIHVLNKKSGTNRERLDFLIELPELKKGDYRCPKIAEIMTDCKITVNDLWVDCVKVGQRPICRLEGYYVAAYKKNEESDWEYFYKKIPEDHYKEYNTDRFSGVADYVSDLQTNKKGRGIYYCKDLVDKEGNVIENSYLVDVVLFYRISFQVQKTGTEANGINLKSAMECLKYFVTKFYLSRGNSEENRIYYKHIIFHGSDYDDDELDLFTYYALDENGKTKLKEFGYDMDDYLNRIKENEMKKQKQQEKQKPNL